jgi:hypothetical protein
MNKLQIIDEIKRTASENKGKPLGRLKFETETGIKTSDWLHTHWTKWGDALIEAGYRPNELQAPYEEDFLINSLIELIREIHKYPTTAEIRLKSHNDPDFPGHNTFSSRLGNKTTIIQKVYEYVKNIPEYSDVASICKEASDTNRIKTETEGDIPNGTNTEWGHVYLMKYGSFYKIGKSYDVDRRNREIGTKLPEELKTIHTIKTDDPTGIESYWHKRFAQKRTRGEWFKLDRSDISSFKRRKFM